MIAVRRWPLFLARCCRAWFSPRQAAIHAEYRSTLHLQTNAKLYGELAEVRRQCDSAERELVDTIKQRDAALAQLEVLQIQMDLCVQWRTTELERMMAEARISAAKCRSRREDDDGNKLLA